MRRCRCHQGGTGLRVNRRLLSPKSMEKYGLFSRRSAGAAMHPVRGSTNFVRDVLQSCADFQCEKTKVETIFYKAPGAALRGRAVNLDWRTTTVGARCKPILDDELWSRLKPSLPPLKLVLVSRAGCKRVLHLTTFTSVPCVLTNG